MRKFLQRMAVLGAFILPASAQTADEIIAKHIKGIGGMEKIRGIKTLRSTGRFTGGGGFEASLTIEKKRPDRIRQEILMQGMTGITAYDGKVGWKIEPWGGKKDPEPLSEEEMKQVVEDSDFDGPLINYQQKGSKVEFAGMDPVEGTDAFKLKLTLKNGDVRYYYMDTDYYVPIKIETKRMVRGAEQEFETWPGDYKEVAGVYMPYSVESGTKGGTTRAKINFEKIEANVPLDDTRFVEPPPAARSLRADSLKLEETNNADKDGRKQ